MGTKRRTRRTAVRRKVKRSPARKRAARRTRRKPARAAKRTTRRPRRKAAKRRPNPEFMRPVQPDAALSAVVGNKPLPRTQLTKKLWNYIKRNGLQDRVNRRMINADARLRPVFNGKSKVSMFEMTKLVSKHVR